MIKLLINGITFHPQFSKFPGGEVHVNIRQGHFPIDPRHVVIDALVQSSDDILRLALVHDAILLERWDLKSFRLNLPYIPYARQDRVCEKGEAFGLKYLCNLINEMKFDEVIVDDPHSLVAPALLDNVVVVNSIESHKLIGTADFLVIPDFGATKKIQAIAHKWNKPTVQFAKTRKGRDRMVIAPVDKIPETGNALVIDDICDRGGTFLGIAEFLNSADLLVTHGIFSRGKEILLKQFNAVEAVYDWTK